MKKDYVEVPRKEARKRKGPEAIPLFLSIRDDLNGEKVSLDLVESLLTSSDLDSEADKVSVGYMYVATLAAYAEERFLNFKDKVKAYRAELDEKARDGEITARVTNAKVEAWIQRDIPLQKMNKRLNRYQRQHVIFDAARQAFDIKSRMIQTKSANARRLSELPDPKNTSRPMRALKRERE